MLELLTVHAMAQILHMYPITTIADSTYVIKDPAATEVKDWPETTVTDDDPADYSPSLALAIGCQI